MSRGRECSECESKGAGDDGLCTPCRLVKNGEIESRSEYFSKLGRKGAAKQKQMRERGKGIDEAELPPLNSHEHAQIWLEVIGRAIGTGRLGDREGNAMIRAVTAWVDTEAEKLTTKELEALQKELERVQEEIAGGNW